LWAAEARAPHTSTTPQSRPTATPAPPADARAEQARRAADLRTAEGAAKWAAENPDLARLIVNDRENQTRGKIANITGSLRNAWGKGPARDRFLAQIEGALGEQKATAAQPSDRRQAGDTRQTASAVGRKAGAEYESITAATAATNTASSGRDNVSQATENSPSPVTPSSSHIGKPSNASSGSRGSSGLSASSEMSPPQNGRPNVRAHATVPTTAPSVSSHQVESDYGTVSGATPGRGESGPASTPPAATLAEGGFATLTNGSRVPFAKGAVSENGDIVVPGKGGRPGRTIPASSVVRIESTEGRQIWRRLLTEKPNLGPSSRQSTDVETESGRSERQVASSAAKSSSVGSLQERREAARARLAAAQTELRQLNVGLGKTPIVGAARPADQQLEWYDAANRGPGVELADPSDSVGPQTPSVGPFLGNLDDVVRSANHIASDNGFAKKAEYVLPSDVAEFAGRFEFQMNAAVANRMRKLGIPEESIGLKGTPMDQAFELRSIMGGSNLHPKWSGVSSPAIRVDVAVLDARFNDSSPTWATASWKDRIDAVIAHEWAEVFSDARSSAARHNHALQSAADTSLLITQVARQILLEDRLFRPKAGN